MSSHAISSIFILFLISLVNVWGNVPSGFKLDVRPECGSDGIEDATLRVVTDMTLIFPSVQCLNGTANMTTTDDVHFNLPVSYTPRTDQQCVFQQRNGGLYYVVLSISYGQTGLETEFRSLTYTITCSFATNGDNITEGHEVINGLIAPQQVVNVVGQDSNASLTLMIMDVLGNDITGSNITMGRQIQLKLEANNTIGSGIYPVSCYGSSGTDKYDVLRAGCGDGVIFPKDIGFTTTGNVSQSPYFKAFGFGGSSLLAIECIVAQCTSDCDGDSCRNANRRRRETTHDDDYQYYVAATSTKTLIDPQPFRSTNDQESDYTPTSVENSSQIENDDSKVGLPSVVISQKSSQEEPESSESGYDVFGSVTHHQVKGSPRKELNRIPVQGEDEIITGDRVRGEKVKQSLIGKPKDSDNGREHDPLSQSDNTGPQKSVLGSKNDVTTEDEEYGQVDQTNTLTEGAKNENLHGKSQLQKQMPQPDSESLHNPEMSSPKGIHEQSKFLGLLRQNEINNPKSDKYDQADGQKQSNASHVDNSKTGKSISDKSKNSSLQEVPRRPADFTAPVIHVIPKGKASVPTALNASLSDSDVLLVKENIPVHENKEEHVLSKPVSLYVVGIVIVALFSLANIALAISLCKRQN